ncbi:O-antigen ligase family protein [Amphritea sp. HPY]|uniref:O-antigen ligase family protein n=1 Tax=Amphritea sp. HPY TaxID=3421652 RepID=UPI003D7DF16F
MLTKADKNRSVATLLVCISVAVCLSGVANSFATAFYVAIYELIFILYFYLLEHRIITFRWLRNDKPLLILTLFWLILLTLSLLQLFANEAPYLQLLAASLKYGFILIHILFALCLSSYLSSLKYPASQALYSIPVAVCIIALVYFFSLRLFPPVTGFDFIENPPLATNVRHIGFICTVGATVSGFWILNLSLENRFSLIAILLTLINFSLLFWLGGRTTIGSALISLTLAGFFLKYLSKIKLTNVLLLLLLIFSATWIATFTSVFPWNDATQGVNSLPTDNEGYNRFTSGRLDMWRLAINAALESPWLGLGPEGYRFIPDKQIGVQPHNLFVQLFVEWGFLGGAAFLLLLGYGLIKCLMITWRCRYSQDKSSLPALMVVIALTLHSLTDGTYYHAQPLFLLALGFSIFPALSHKTG